MSSNSSNVSNSSNATCFPIMNSQILSEFNTILISDSVPDTRNQLALESYFKALGMATKNAKIAFQCPKNDGYGQVRYFTSAYLSYILTTQSKDCRNTNPLPLLCKNSIDIAKKTFGDFVLENQCVGKSIQSMQKSFETLTMAVSQGNQTDCISGLNLEQKQCGFVGKNDALKYCNSINSSDPCCKFLNISELSISGPVIEKKDPLVNQNLVIGLSVGAIIFLLLLGAYMYHHIRLKGPSKNLPSDISQLENPSTSDTISQFKDKQGLSSDELVRNSDQSFAVSVLSSVDSVDVSTISSNNHVSQEIKPQIRFGNHKL